MVRQHVTGFQLVLRAAVWAGGLPGFRQVQKNPRVG